MTPLSSTANKPLEFSTKQTSGDYKVPTSKIGWFHTEADQPGAKFDLVIKDSLGREMFRKVGCGNDTAKYGELMNLPTLVGQDIKVEIDNLVGAERLLVFLN